MKKTILLSLALVAILLFSFTYKAPVANTSGISTYESAPELKWYTDLAVANKKSKETKKPIFAFFTGSDWCGWCKRLQATVFKKDDFKSWADTSVILLELDFPRRKKLPAKLAQQNRQLQQLFKVRGYPTVWIFDTKKDAKTNQMQINAWGQLGYPRAQAGKESTKFIADANRVLATKKM